MSPARDIAWPYCTIEIKGPQGQLNVARLQNSLNGAVMMNNMLELRRMLGKEYELLGQIIVVTMELTTESISLCHPRRLTAFSPPSGRTQTLTNHRHYLHMGLCIV
jgi:hypothetical protein